MEFITYEVEGQIGIITINRPKALNALNSAVLDELDKTLDAVDQEAIRCLILTGAGEKSFVAGADIGEMSTLTKAEGEAFGKKGNDVFRKLETFPIPVIAAVNGFALGGGCELALACDLRLASMAASFAVPEGTLGTICGAGGTQRLPRLIGETRAKEMIFTGREITAETAREWGLVNGVFTAGSLLEETLNLAEEIARNSPYAVTRAKRSVNGGREMLLEEALEWERSLFGECGESRDRKEGMTAFLEKRPRVFTGE